MYMYISEVIQTNIVQKKKKKNLVKSYRNNLSTQTFIVSSSWVDYNRVSCIYI